MSAFVNHVLSMDVSIVIQGTDTYVVLPTPP
jgi:hypothetical protein